MILRFDVIYFYQYFMIKFDNGATLKQTATTRDGLE